MIVKRMGRMEPLMVHGMLVREAQKRSASSDRASLQDFAVLYEPEECFSMNHEWDINFIRDWKSFWNYIYERAVPIVPFKRGGGIMWHGPGQIQLAPVVDLMAREIGILDYSAMLEQVCLLTVRAFGIDCRMNHYVNGSQGVWVHDPQDQVLKKIAFFGFHDLRGIAIHGCAINVRPNLEGFSLIDPCNLEGVEVISMEKILGFYTPSVEEVGEVLLDEFIKLLG